MSHLDVMIVAFNKEDLKDIKASDIDIDEYSRYADYIKEFPDGFVDKLFENIYIGKKLFKCLNFVSKELITTNINDIEEYAQYTLDRLKSEINHLTKYNILNYPVENELAYILNNQSDLRFILFYPDGTRTHLSYDELIHRAYWYMDKVDKTELNIYIGKVFDYHW